MGLLTDCPAAGPTPAAQFCCHSCHVCPWHLQQQPLHRVSCAWLSSENEVETLRKEKVKLVSIQCSLMNLNASDMDRRI